MKINRNGITREMTKEEIAQFEQLENNAPPQEPAAEERLAALEQAGMERDAALMELAAMLAGGM